MRLEPRIEKLEARMDDTPKVTEIELVGIGPNGGIVTSAVAYAENGVWTQFTGRARR